MNRSIDLARSLQSLAGQRKMEALAPGPIDPTNIASVELIEMRKQKNQRLQKMRNQERQNAMQKAKEYRERVQDARVAMKQRAETEEAQRRDEELRLVSQPSPP